MYTTTLKKNKEDNNNNNTIMTILRTCRYIVYMRKWVLFNVFSQNIFVSVFLGCKISRPLTSWETIYKNTQKKKTRNKKYELKSKSTKIILVRKVARVLFNKSMMMMIVLMMMMRISVCWCEIVVWAQLKKKIQKTYFS